jgi:hypothetical protein
MTEPAEPDWDKNFHSFKRAFATNLADAVGDRQTLTMDEGDARSRDYAGTDIPTPSITDEFEFLQ